MSRWEKIKVGFIIGGIGSGIISLVYLSYYASHGTIEVVTATVTDKERITTGSGENMESKYLVFTNRETFENTDSLWHGKFNSSDLQGRLKVGETYRFKVYGWRIGFMSSYRNIIEAN